MNELANTQAELEVLDAKPVRDWTDTELQRYIYLKRLYKLLIELQKRNQK